jgi:hypothetical protein
MENGPRTARSRAASQGSGLDQPRSLRAARSVSVPIVPEVDGDEPPVLLVFGDAPMLFVLGAVLSVVLGDVVLGEAVLGDVVPGEVVVLGDVVLGDVVLGDVVPGVVGDDMLGDVGDCAPADELGLAVPLDPVPLVCAYTRLAATASATPVPAAMVLNLLMDCSCL